MNNSPNDEIRNLPNEERSSQVAAEKEISLKSNMTDKEKVTLERLRKFRDLHNQVPDEERIPISHPDKYSVED